MPMVYFIFVKDSPAPVPLLLSNSQRLLMNYG